MDLTNNSPETASEEYSNCCGYSSDDTYNNDTMICGSCQNHCAYEVYCTECSNAIYGEEAKNEICSHCEFAIHKL